MEKTYYPDPELVALQVRHVGRLTKAALIEQDDLEYWAATPDRGEKTADLWLTRVAGEIAEGINLKVRGDYADSDLALNKWRVNGATVRPLLNTPTPLNEGWGVPEGYVPTPDARRPDRHRLMQATMPSRARSGGDLDPCAGKAPSSGLDRLMDELRPLELELGQLQFKAARSQASKVERKRIRQLEYIISCKTIDSKSRGASLTARKDSFQQSHSHAPKGKAAPAKVNEEVARD